MIKVFKYVDHSFLAYGHILRLQGRNSIMLQSVYLYVKFKLKLLNFSKI